MNTNKNIINKVNKSNLDIKYFRKIEKYNNKIINKLLKIPYTQYILIKDLKVSKISYIKNNIIINSIDFFKKKIKKKESNKYIYFFIKNKANYYSKRGIDKNNYNELKKRFNYYIYHPSYINKIYRLIKNIYNELNIYNKLKIKKKINNNIKNNIIKKYIIKYLIANNYKKETKYNKKYLTLINNRIKKIIKKNIINKKIIKINQKKFSLIIKNIKKYFKKINKYKQLIIKKSEKTIKYIINYINNDNSLKDILFQESLLIIIKVIDKYNFRFKMSFNNYIKPWILERIKKYIIKQNKLNKNKPNNIINIKPLIKKNSINYYYNNYIKDNKKIKDLFTNMSVIKNINIIIKLLNYIPKIEKKIIILRYGLIDKEFKTLEQIGNKFNLSKERIRQLEKTGLNKLKSIIKNNNIKNNINIY